MKLHLIAPSGSVPDPQVLAKGESWFKEQGIEVKNLACGKRQFQRFAGTDQERLDEINQLANLSPDHVVMSLRGGYGLSRLLDRIARCDSNRQPFQKLTWFRHVLLVRVQTEPSFETPRRSH
jgi:muramoyltetrapeptide carboxypeptidase LdcA involved in peptidoglycan recycling